MSFCSWSFPGETNDRQDVPLYLEVYINEQTTRLIAAFWHSPATGMSVSAKELVGLGLKPPQGRTGDDVVMLSEIPGLRYRYDEETQVLYVKVDDRQRITKRHDARASDRAAVGKADPGLVFNYGLFASASEDPEENNNALDFDGASLTYDARAFNHIGTLSSSGIFSSDDKWDAEFLRLETSLTRSDTEAVRTYTIGDSISGGLNWSRPVRFGGIQVQSNFSLRPDLLTIPLPSVSGSAAVPSTVDVYVGNVKAHSQAVEAGPFEINNIPAISGAGVARVVVKDATGRESETTSAFYNAPSLLRQGLHDYSAEIGATRRNYAVRSDDYSSHVFGSASSRYGLTDGITFESNIEVTDGLLKGGVGYVVTIANQLLLSGAVAGSRARDHKDGLLFYGALDTQFAGLSIHASSQRTSGDFQDLASVNARRATEQNDTTASLSGIAVPKRFDQVAIGLPLPSIAAGITASFANIETGDNDPSRVLSATYTHSLSDRYSFYATVFNDLAKGSSSSVFAGVSVVLGDRSRASAGFRNSDDSTSYTASYVKQLDQQPGSFGWRLRNTEGENSSNRFGALSYRGRAAKMEATITDADGTLQGTGFAEGAIAVAGGGIFFSPRIDDAFAIVDAGAPDVPVRLANRRRGKTGSDGKMLVPGLLSYEKNKIQIDIDDLPINAHIPETTKHVAPADRAGVVVEFNVDTQTRSAVIIFTDAGGNHLPAGSTGAVDGTGEEFVIGYDGMAFIQRLDATNGVVVELDQGTCRAHFPYRPQENAQVVIGPVQCL